jgi:putative membrane protein
MQKTSKYLILIILFFIGLIISGIQPFDYFTWALEVFPALIGLVILIATFKKFQFTYFTYSLILIHCYILFIGGHYTYAKVPFFDWIQEVFQQSRNNYDKVGHFAQGFVPAAIVRELFVRKNIITSKSWMNVLIVCVCVTISVFYEFLEWLVAILSGESADSFLGTQGYIWDTQSDMLFATIGAITFLVLLSKVQDKYIKSRLN